MTTMMSTTTIMGTGMITTTNMTTITGMDTAIQPVITPIIQENIIIIKQGAFL